MGLKGLFEISKLLFQYSPGKNRDLRPASSIQKPASIGFKQYL